MAKRLIVITGAAGMIGSGVVRHLNDQGNHQLLLVDDLKQGLKWKNLVGKQFVDLISKNHLLDWLKGNENVVDAIIHLGACSDTVETNGDYLLENNYRYTIKLAEWALSFGKRFIYASSAATYGDGKKGFQDDEERIEELAPLNLYAFSKQLVDLWMKREKAFGKVVGLKYFNVFGPNEYHKGRMASMVLKMAHKAQEEGVIQLYKSNEERFGDGDQCRDFIYVKDAVAMTCRFLEPEHRSLSGLFNVGQGQVTTWNQLAKALFKALKKPARIDYIDMPGELSKQYQNYTCAEMGKLHALFPTQSTPIVDAVQDYVCNYLLQDARW
jgi:ADP-L-glycero-D-manno-heptose 6-epimerase